MPRRDLYHKAVAKALEKGGWTITDDPLRLNYGTRNLYVDLGAENLLAAEKEDRLIAVEVKSFAGESDMHDLEMALGQFVLYRGILAKIDSERTLYLAIPSFAFDDVFADQFGQTVIEQHELRLLVFEEDQQEVLRWLR